MVKSTYILLLLLFTLSSRAQKVMKVVTLPTQVEYVFAEEFLLEIDAEKANIEIIVVEGNTVKVSLRQSAKNADVRKAEKDLTFIHFAHRKERNRLYLHNYVKLDANSQRLTSIVDNNYVIEVPRHCHIKMKNELGNVLVKGAEKSMRFDLEYSSLSLEQCTGKLYIDSRIGDVKVNNSALDGDFILDNVSLRLKETAGSFDVDAKFGDITCMMSEHLTLFKADVEHCEITLINRTNLAYSYAIESQNASIVALDDLLQEKTEKINDDMQLYLKPDDAHGTVIINTNYSDVNLF